MLAAVVAGACVFCLLVVEASRRYKTARRGPPAKAPGAVSILKPLSGAEEGLEENLRSFFTQDFAGYEILFAVREASDPAVAVVRRLQGEFPLIPSKLLVTGEPPYPNSKVFGLARMMAEARHDLLVMSDSDIRVGADFLRVIAGEFGNPGLHVTTCPYRAAPGKSIWSVLEAIGMNTEFLAGILVARMIEGMKFAVGPTIVARRGVIEAIGGWERLKNYLAEDFVLGKLAAEAGFGVDLSSYVIEHRIGSQRWRANARHRLRWSRSTRRSRPAGYLGQAFTNPLPWALMLAAAAPAWWPLAALGALLRAAAAWATAGWVLRDPLCARRWWLIPSADLMSFASWIAGFFGNTVTWRGRRYIVERDGKFRPA